MRVEGAVALVTGANRGLGRHFAEALVRRGAAKVYGAARRPEQVTSAGVVPIRLDITDEASVRAADAETGDVTLLINNAGMASGASLLDGPMDEIRAVMESHFFGTLAVTRGFAPQLVSNGPSAVLNVVSVVSWIHPSMLGAYAAAKTAVWAQSDALREELGPLGVALTALHIGFMDTEMIADLDTEKISPAVVADMALDGVEGGAVEVLTDELTRSAKSRLSTERVVGEPDLFAAYL